MTGSRNREGQFSGTRIVHTAQLGIDQIPDEVLEISRLRRRNRVKQAFAQFFIVIPWKNCLPYPNWKSTAPSSMMAATLLQSERVEDSSWCVHHFLTHLVGADLAVP